MMNKFKRKSAVSQPSIQVKPPPPKRQKTSTIPPPPSEQSLDPETLPSPFQRNLGRFSKEFFGYIRLNWLKIFKMNILKILILPLARVKKVMKLDPDVKVSLCLSVSQSSRED